MVDYRRAVVASPGVPSAGGVACTHVAPVFNFRMRLLSFGFSFVSEIYGLSWHYAGTDSIRPRATVCMLVLLLLSSAPGSIAATFKSTLWCQLAVAQVQDPECDQRNRCVPVMRREAPADECCNMLRTQVWQLNMQLQSVLHSFRNGCMKHIALVLLDVRVRSV